MAQYPPAVRHPVTFFRFIVLESAQPSIQMEVVSMGHSRISIIEINVQVVLLSCFAELGLFDEVAVTLRVAD